MPRLNLTNKLDSLSAKSIITGSNYSLAFDGSNDYIDIADTDLTGAFTIGAWVKLATDGGSEEHHLIGSASTDDAFRIDVDSDRLVFRVGGSNYNLTSLSLSLGTWHFVAITRDGSDNVIGYVDASASSSVGSASGTFTMAKIGETHSSWELEGNISELFYYDTALSAIQISQIYKTHPFNHATSSFVGDLEGWWKMGDGTEQGSGTTIYDMSRNSNNGTMTNMDASTDYETDTP